MSVAEEADVPLNGSKDITLAVSMSELEHMSTSVVICDQDIVGAGRGGTGHKAVMGVYEGTERGIYSNRVGGAGGGHELKPSPPMSAKVTLVVKTGEIKIILENPVPIPCAGLGAFELQQEKRFVPLSESGTVQAKRLSPPTMAFITVTLRIDYRFFNASKRLANTSNSSTGPSSFAFGSGSSVGGMSGSLGTLTSVSTFAFTFSNTSSFSFSPPFIHRVRVD